MVYLLTVISGRVLRSIGVLSAAGYAVLWFGYAHGWGWIVTGDDQALRSAHDYGVNRFGWIGFWNVVSTVLGPSALRLMAAVGIVAALLRGQRRVAAFLALSVFAMGVVTAGAKALADRPRPETALTFATSSSFPSGHALGIMVGVLACLTVALPRLSRYARVWAVAGGAAAVLLVGAARVVLNVHHPTDVLAGWALGYLWFLVCVTIVPPDRRLRDRRCATR